MWVGGWGERYSFFVWNLIFLSFPLESRITNLFADVLHQFLEMFDIGAIHFEEVPPESASEHGVITEQTLQPGGATRHSEYIDHHFRW